MKQRLARAGLMLCLAGAAVSAPLGAQPMPPHAVASGAALPPSTLATDARGWRVWWRAESAPVRWSGADSAVLRAIVWRHRAPGVEVGTLRLAGSGEARRMAIVVVRLDPRLVTFSLAATDDGEGGFASWSVGDAAAPDPSLVAAFNAGQFGAGGPWGWLVMDGVERQRPGVGPLSSAFVRDAAGGVALVDADSIAARRRAGGIVEAFQSYPTILRGDGEVPEALRGAGRGVSVSHRDARFAIGVQRDGRVLLALTRFDLLGGAFSELPLGPTVPEMAAIMGALGCAQAMLLDGGISAQLHVARARTWEGNRRVPLAMFVRRR